MAKPLLSVIVPVFNVEKYIRKSVDSILFQTYDNLEILLIDDGSTDHSGKICDEYLKKDKRIKVIHKSNEGVAQARITGIEKAIGQLIAFVDPDDYIDEKMFESMYERLVRDDSDIVVCDLIWVDNNGKVIKDDSVGKEYVLDAESAMENLLNVQLIKPYVVDKIYKAELIKNIHFKKGKIHEDVLGSFQAIGMAKRISITSNSYYFYIQRDDSIMGVGFSSKRLDELDAFQERCDYVKIHFANLYYLAIQKYALRCMFYYQKAMLTHQGSGVLDNISSRKKYYKNALIYKGMNFKTKIWLFGFIRLPKLICSIRNSLKVGI